MHKEIDKDITAKGCEKYPMVEFMNTSQFVVSTAKLDGYCQGAMDERQRINTEISKIESWITENRPHLAGLGALSAMLKQVKAVETLPEQDKWISRDERLPTIVDLDDDFKVWAYNSLENERIKVNHIEFELYPDLTYWQPITKPQPPKI